MPKAISIKIHQIDAAEKAVGRVASEAARLLIGKHKADYAPNVDAGDKVVIVNAGKVKFTGRKLVQKDYYHHTRYPRGLRRTPMKKVMGENPSAVLERAVSGMLPKNNLRNDRLKRLTIKN